MKLDRVLVERGVLSADEARAAVESSLDLNASLVDTLLGSGRVSSEELAWHAAEAHGLPVVDLDPTCVDDERTRELGELALRRLEAVPLHAVLGEPVVAVVDPDPDRRRELTKLLQEAAPLQFVVTQREQLHATLDRIFGPGDREAADSGDDEALAPEGGEDAVLAFHAALATALREGFPTVRLEPCDDGHRLALHRRDELRLCARLPSADADTLRATLRALSASGEATTLATPAGVVRVDVHCVRTAAGEVVLVRTDAEPSGASGKGVAGAREALAGGPVILVAGEDARTRAALARAVVESGAGVVASVGVDVERGLRTTDLEDARALRPDVLVCSGELDARIAESCRRTRCLLLVTDRPTARTALAAVPPGLRAYVRGAFDELEWVEVFPWT